MYIIFLVHIKLKDGGKFLQELTIPERDALAKTFPFHEFMNEIEYEGLCEVHGLLPDKLAQNGTTLGDITTVIFYTYQHCEQENETRIRH